MNDAPDLIALLNTELGLDLEPGMAALPLESLPGWDSMLLLRLIGVLEEACGRPLPVADVLAADSLEQIRALAVAR
ncbi:acyl carrier protein [Streptacidiphilus sp. PB12-B1b]|uniref:acyl carrier protein n=1 Tax=Streptacidiphilus sp. PB12-B1b TaxID=2705012 RepID=UPI0015FBDA7B|nr:acyl carrier protein [Streptacidiphilus sp. PB12-B1b]QMU78138.1 acyl carrier protein [Streptacidiphilus sp. PB12-B1b]